MASVPPDRSGFVACRCRRAQLEKGPSTDGGYVASVAAVGTAAVMATAAAKASTANNTTMRVLVAVRSLFAGRRGDAAPPGRRPRDRLLGRAPWEHEPDGRHPDGRQRCSHDAPPSRVLGQ